MAPSKRLSQSILVLLFFGFVGLEIYGLCFGRLFSQEIWSPTGLDRLKEYSAFFLAASAPVLLLVPWTFAALAATFFIGATAVAVGAPALCAPVFFLVSAYALGSRLLGRDQPDSLQSQLCATLLGVSVYILLMTLLVRLAIHYAASWGALLAIPILLDWRGVRNWLASLARILRSIELRIPSERAAFALLIFILGMHWLVTLKPEASADGLAVHLAIPANIAAHHAMTFEPGRIVWAVMPMGADWIYSIVYLLGGEFAARLLNFFLLLILEALLYCAARRWLPRVTALLIVALFASTPIVQLVTGSLFVENLLADLAFGMMTAIWSFGESRQRRFFYLAAVLGGTALATKLGALAFVGAAVPFAAFEARRGWNSLGRRPSVSCACACGLFLAFALPPYAIAWWKTGNPVFPFLNARFPSPLLVPSANTDADSRFVEPLTWSTPFDLTFHTHRFYEGQDGSFGFQFLLLAPLVLAALALAPRRPAVSGGLVALAGMALILKQAPNARYVYPALPLILASFAALLGWMHYNQRWLYRVSICFLIGCTVLNAYFLPSSSWYHKDFYLSKPFSGKAREAQLGDVSPIRKVIQQFNADHPGAVLLVATDGDLADISGESYEYSWHEYTVFDRIRRALSVPDLLRIFDEWKVRFLIGRKTISAVSPTALRDVLEFCVTPEFEIGDLYLARLNEDCNPPDPPLTVAQPGVYDDYDPVLRFRGYWLRSDDFTGAYRHSVSYSDIAGSEVSLAFEGRALTYGFTKAPNRGVAEITIDGAVKGTVDLYSPHIEWQNHWRICCLSGGRHVAAVRVTGRSRPGSQGKFVDLDSLIVE